MPTSVHPKPATAPDSAQTPAPAVRLSMDGSGAEADAAVRRAAGIVALLSGLWLLLVADHVVQALFGLAALVFGGLWLRRTSRRADASAAPDHLELDARGLRVVTDRGAMAVAWQDTTGVALDEDRLQVLVMRAALEPCRIEAGYGGLPLRDLAEMIHEWRTRHGPCNPRLDD